MLERGTGEICALEIGIGQVSTLELRAFQYSQLVDEALKIDTFDLCRD